MPHVLTYFHSVRLVLSVVIVDYCILDFINLRPLAFVDALAYRILPSKAACSHSVLHMMFILCLMDDSD